MASGPFGKIAVATLLAVLAGSTGASASPPQSCAAKFAGTWEWTGGGATYDVTFQPDGRISCATCSDMTWSCAGRTFVYYYGRQKVAIMSLAADGNTMSGVNLVVTSAPQFAVRKDLFRQGANRPEKKAKAPPKSPAPPKPVAGPFLTPPVCPKGSSAVQGERTYTTGTKVPVWYCFKVPGKTQ
jgi:hypothetical protein